MEKKIKIGITQCNPETTFNNYVNWIKSVDESIEVVALSYEKDNFEEAEECDGILMSGGVDVYPTSYNNQRTSYPPQLEKTVFDEKRDKFEFSIFEMATNESIPVLAICRGMQLVNVALEGDLIQDLEEVGKNNHRKMDKIDGLHTISVVSNSLLHEICQTTSGNINSAHHQAIGKLSEELIVSAVSPDGVVEAVELKNKDEGPWLLCVQWHPERMNDKEENPFSRNIKTAFLEEVKRNQK